MDSKEEVYACAAVQGGLISWRTAKGTLQNNFSRTQPIKDDTGHWNSDC